MRATLRTRGYLGAASAIKCMSNGTLLHENGRAESFTDMARPLIDSGFQLASNRVCSLIKAALRKIHMPYHESDLVLNSSQRALRSDLPGRSGTASQQRSVPRCRMPDAYTSPENAVTRRVRATSA